MAVWHKAGATFSYPKTYALSASSTFATCQQCVSADIGILASAPATSYLAQGGTLTITAPSGGSIKVSGASLHLIEWDNAADAPVANPKCMDVASFSFQGTYPAPGADGGA